MKCMYKKEIAELVGVSRKTLSEKLQEWAENEPDFWRELHVADMTKQRVFTPRQVGAILERFEVEIPTYIPARIRAYNMKELTDMFDCNYRTLVDFMDTSFKDKKRIPFSKDDIADIFMALGHPPDLKA